MLMRVLLLLRYGADLRPDAGLTGAACALRSSPRLWVDVGVGALSLI